MNLTPTTLAGADEDEPDSASPASNSTSVWPGISVGLSAPHPGWKCR